MRQCLKILVAAILSTIGGGPGEAQHHGGPQPSTSHGQPYAGLQQRDVKALSDTQLADLRAGRGIGLALAAELNGYPGPMHALELADALRLDPPQRQELQRQITAMRAEAIVAGERVIVAEAALDRAFAQRHITADALAALTADAGAAQAALRAAHLKYHLTTAALMTPEQRDRYAVLRGYR